MSLVLGGIILSVFVFYCEIVDVQLWNYLLVDIVLVFANFY